MDISKVISCLLMVLTFACLIQFLTEIIKKIVGNKIMNYISANVLAAILGVLFAFSFNVDLFICFELQCSVPYISYIVSGLIMSAGSPAIYEFIQYVREQRKMLQETVKEED